MERGPYFLRLILCELKLLLLKEKKKGKRMGEVGTRDIALWQGTYPVCEAQSSVPRTIKQVYLKENNYFCKLLSSLRAIKMILENK